MRQGRARVALAFIALIEILFSWSATAQSITGWSEKQQARRREQFAALTSAQVAKAITVADDDLETVATISTEPVFKFKAGFTDRVRADTFLRALISKNSSRVVYQLYAHISYTGANWRDFRSATFETGEEPGRVPLIQVDRKVDCQYGACAYTEDVAFEVPRTLLESIAARAGSVPATGWRFRFKAQSSEDWTDDMPPVEIAGLLARVDRFRTERKLP